MNSGLDTFLSCSGLMFFVCFQKNDQRRGSIVYSFRGLSMLTLSFIDRLNRFNCLNAMPPLFCISIGVVNHFN